MKKVLLSVLAGIVIIGSASAVPSPDVRKKACEQQTDKIWVEKNNGACIDVNPCNTDNADVRKAYCPLDLMLPYSIGQYNAILNTYARNVLKTTVANINVIQSADTGPGYIGVKTSDGGYFSVLYGSRELEDDDFVERGHTAALFAFAAHGCVGTMLTVSDTTMSCNVTSEQECDEIRNLASVLGATNLEEIYTSGKCVLGLENLGQGIW